MHGNHTFLGEIRIHADQQITLYVFFALHGVMGYKFRNRTKF